MSKQKTIDYLKVRVSKKMSPEQINGWMAAVCREPYIDSCEPVFIDEDTLAPYGDKETDAIPGYEVNRLKMEKPGELLQKMLVGRSIVGVSRRDDDEVDLHFSDGTTVNFKVSNYGGQLPDLVISKEMYVEKTVLETVEV